MFIYMYICFCKKLVFHRTLTVYPYLVYCVSEVQVGSRFYQWEKHARVDYTCPKSFPTCVEHKGQQREEIMKFHTCNYHDPGYTVRKHTFNDIFVAVCYHSSEVCSWLQRLLMRLHRMHSKFGLYDIMCFLLLYPKKSYVFQIWL